MNFPLKLTSTFLFKFLQSALCQAIFEDASETELFADLQASSGNLRWLIQQAQELAMCFAHIRLVHQKSHTQISSILALGNKHADALATNACSLNWRMQEMEDEDREVGVGEVVEGGEEGAAGGEGDQAVEQLARDVEDILA